MKESPRKLSVFSMTTALFLLGSSIAFAASAGSEQDQSATSSEAVQQEMTEALAALKDYTVERRDEMIEEVKQLLAYLDQRIDRLSSQIEAQSASVTDSVKAQWQETLKTLRNQRMKVAEWLGGLQYSSQDAWEEVKEGFSQAYQELSELLQSEEDKMEASQASSS